jgi:transcriptional regulator GlxA family with amidase domain
MNAKQTYADVRFRPGLNRGEIEMNRITTESQANTAVPGSPGGRSEHCGPEAAARIEQSVAYMTQHLNQPLQVATLAARVSISPSHFFALFKRRVGVAPMDYFTRLRMERACRLLETTSLSVKQVAAELGYDDPFYFSRVFKSVNQVAPSDFRVARRNAAGKTKDAPPVLAGFSSEPGPVEAAKQIQFA